ncbi:MAG: LicD family protein [Lachnospiraceae bacterium]|nr:LicD family protein [Lachnospiraceae bacterium]
MTSEEFLKEALAWDECPADFEETYKEFQVYQGATAKTLAKLHRVCEKNQVNYQLAYGSLLGVVRDGGQIPWDYDVDVLVPYAEKEKLLEALRKDLGSEYYAYSPDLDPRCRHMIMRLAPKEYRTEALHVDVFFLIGSPEDEAERRAFARQMADISEKRYGKFVNLIEESMGRPRRFASLLLKRKLPALFASVGKIDRTYRELAEKYPLEGSSYYVTADTYADWKDYPAELMKETEVVETGYGPIRVPVRREELLALLYGDYMSVPPLQRRIHEVKYHTNRIRLFQQRAAK